MRECAGKARPRLDRPAIGRDAFGRQGLLVTAKILQRAVELCAPTAADRKLSGTPGGPSPAGRTAVSMSVPREPGGLLVDERTVEQEQGLERYEEPSRTAVVMLVSGPLKMVRYGCGCRR